MKQNFSGKKKNKNFEAKIELSKRSYVLFFRKLYSPDEPLCWVVASELFVFTVFIVW